jgi:hypothetical protein
MASDPPGSAYNGFLNPQSASELHAQQRAAQQQATWQSVHAQAAAYVQTGRLSAVNVSMPLLVVARRRIDQAIDQLPLRALARIKQISFFDISPMCFVVYYTNDLITEFEDVEGFPSDEQLARILLDLA